MSNAGRKIEFSKAQIERLVRSYESGTTLKDLARNFSVTAPTIKRILRGVLKRKKGEVQR